MPTKENIQQTLHHKPLGFLSVSLHLMPQISWFFLLPTVGRAMVVKCEQLIFMWGSVSFRSCRELSVTIPKAWRVFNVGSSPSSLEGEKQNKQINELQKWLKPFTQTACYFFHESLENSFWINVCSYLKNLILNILNWNFMLYSGHSVRSSIAKPAWIEK